MNVLRKFYIKHPKFRRYFDTAGVIFNWTMILYYIVAFIMIASIIIGFYLALPEEIGTVAAAITGSLLTVMIIPMITDNINKRTELQSQQFEKNNDFYEELSKQIIVALKTEEDAKIKELSKFIGENYPEICINMSQSLIDNLLLLKEECDLKFSPNINAKFDIDTMAYFAEKCIKMIRRQGNIEGKFYFDQTLTCKEGANNP